MFNQNFNIDNLDGFYGVRDGLIPFILSSLVQTNNVLYIAKNDLELSNIYNFFLENFQNVNVYSIPAWDCLPYDISSPNFNIISERVKSFTKLSFFRGIDNKNIILTTVNGLLIKTAPRNFYSSNFLNITKHDINSLKYISNFLSKIGYTRVETVRESGEFGIRGSILDLFPVGSSKAFRIDFIGDEIDSMKVMDPLTQRSSDLINNIDVYPSNEYLLDEKNIKNFRQKFRLASGSESLKSQTYEKVSSGVKFQGIEHFLPLIHQSPLSSIFDFFYSDPKSVVVLAKNFFSLINKRYEEIENFVDERKFEKSDNSVVKVDDLYLSKQELDEKLALYKTIELNEFDYLDNKTKKVINLYSKPLLIPNDPNLLNNNRISMFVKFCINQYLNNKKILIVTEDKSRLTNLINFFDDDLKKHNINFNVIEIEKLVSTQITNNFNFSSSPYIESFEINDHLIVFDRDIFGTAEKKKKSWRRKTENFLKDVNNIDTGDLVAHIDHGIGKYDGLEKIVTNGIDHDCLRLLYHGGDKLYLPVENMNLLSRVGDNNLSRDLDKLGAANWQNRKANVRKKIKDMAEKLIRVAAQREIISTEKLLIPDEYYTFSKNFPFELTDDQETAINDIIADLETGKLMDRLICGDVGFGKTEVALRASFIVANAGYQVALVAPTTILVKQHFKSFFDRFKKSSLSIASLSRMTSLKDRKKIKDDLKSGNINVVIGTHALLSNDIDFNNLGLLIVDEEQHFGVGQKEKIKELQGNIHVLTLTATPIPRTLQLSLSGLKELSLITTPPINRLSVRTFVLEWDNVVLIDALLREKNRGGQTFVVCPRVRDIDDLYQKINRMVPNLVISVAHGQMKIDELDKSINSFSEGKSDILISTNIIESGIDIPNANTMIIHKSDLFGLSQLYQLRGRVGRGKHRAYSYFTIEPGKILLNKSQQRLDVIKTLDNLGAGFSLASYDMDIRGSGNLLGDEQSGQIKEVGVELYQDMLKEAVSSYKDSSKKIEEVWSPSISLGLSILIPEDYVFDLPTRMSLYRKAGELSSPEDINTFTEELFDRFGPPPEEVNNLLMTLMIKNKCLYNKINIIDAGPKGVLLGFKNNFFNNADKLLGWVTKKSGQVKIRPDQKLFLQKTLNTREEKFNAVLSLIEELQLLNN